MKERLAYFSALLTTVFLTIESFLPARIRRGIGQWVTIVIIIVIITAGGVVVVYLVLFPGGTSTTTIYP